MTDCAWNVGKDGSGGVICANTEDLIHPGSVPAGFCAKCPYRIAPASKGFGDVVSKALSFIGVEKKEGCGCEERQAAWNSRGIVHDNWFVAVTSAPRRRPTLRLCLESLWKCGWSPVVFAEPKTVVPDGFHAIRNETRKGVWNNWVDSVRYAIEQTDAEYILTVQDDSLFHPESKQLLDATKWPRAAGFISLYTPTHYAMNREPGIQPVRTGSMWGACALAWKREMLEQVLSHRLISTWVGAGPRRKKKDSKQDIVDRRASLRRKHTANPHLIANSDTAIGKICNALGKTMYWVNPSPVRHIATTSTIPKHGGNSGRRNCNPCADHQQPLLEQVYPMTKTYDGRHVFVIRSAYCDLETSARRLEVSYATLIPCLKNQTRNSFELIVLVDEKDPCLPERKQAFESIGVPVHYHWETWDEPTLLTRVDDDDCIANDFSQRLQSAASGQRSGVFVFPSGMMFSDGSWRKWNYDGNMFVSILARNSRDLFAHTHRAILKRHRLHRIPTERPMWIWVRHTSALSRTNDRLLRLPKAKFDANRFNGVSFPQVMRTCREKQIAKLPNGYQDSQFCFTSLDDIATRHGTDKSTAGHGYTDIYEELFRDRRLSISRVLEFGVHTGASLRMWAEYFTEATVFGIEKRSVRGNFGPRVKVVKGSCTVWRNLGDAAFDLIVDDASHQTADQMAAWNVWHPFVAVGGWYVIEDLHVQKKGGANTMLAKCLEWVQNPPEGWRCRMEMDNQLALLQRVA